MAWVFSCWPRKPSAVISGSHNALQFPQCSSPSTGALAVWFWNIKNWLWDELMWKLPQRPVAWGITGTEWPTFYSWCASSRGLFRSLPELSVVWERTPQSGSRKAKPWEALLHNLLFVYSLDGKGTFSAEGLPVHPAQSAKSFSWLRKTLGCLNESKWFLKDALCLFAQHKPVIITHYYQKGRNSLSNLGQNHSCKMDSHSTDQDLAKPRGRCRDSTPWS